MITLEYVWTPGSVSAQTVAVRFGPSTSARTITMNTVGGNTLGGVALSRLILEEIH